MCITPDGKPDRKGRGGDKNKGETGMLHARNIVSPYKIFTGHSGNAFKNARP